MKNLIPFCLFLLMFSCKTSVKTESKPITITSAEVKDVVTYLASDERLGRNTGTQGIDESATYIENQLKSYGVKPYYDTYRDHFKIGETNAFNVVGFIEGTDKTLKNEVIILGAHYDHIGKAKIVEGDSIANGANDNAAGTSAVLAMAKYFAAKKTNKRSIMVALFSAEEMGLLGSKHLAERLKSENLNLYTMVNFEMIGVPFKDRDYEAFVSGYDLSNMAAKLNEYVGQNLIGYSEVSKKYSLFKRSDNYPFYEQFKLPCHTISSCDLTNFDFYHHVDDEIDKLDFEFMASLINKMIPAIEKMSATETKEIIMYEE
ncbi:M20/M25/M40 family metallo-hydrolase [Psychroserpens sp. SPM9]|uniref:M28 family metallopeptidase n=1 Tax=Psychroserpens sp. SPM9 TaxID=2975598 RepID=UPI0021A3CAD2|nr:M20/M25/M40 family metallo-hydrolase [Psychroserpens sp. SPM9]MDG5492300.1 M20/M25/M40 family metallo-hydrolase [Psychroserpens sp. SPM9]